MYSTKAGANYYLFIQDGLVPMVSAKWRNFHWCQRSVFKSFPLPVVDSAGYSLDTTVAISFLRTISQSELVVYAHAWPWFDEEGSRNAAPGTPSPDRYVRLRSYLYIYIYFLGEGRKRRME